MLCAWTLEGGLYCGNEATRICQGWSLCDEHAERHRVAVAQRLADLMAANDRYFAESIADINQIVAGLERRNEPKRDQ